MDGRTPTCHDRRVTRMDSEEPIAFPIGAKVQVNGVPGVVEGNYRTLVQLKHADGKVEYVCIPAVAVVLVPDADDVVQLAIDAPATDGVIPLDYAQKQPPPFRKASGAK